MDEEKKFYLLIAHGSRLEEANEELRRLVERLSDRIEHKIIACFLELVEPSLATAIDQAVAGGASRVKVLPYFLAQGRHVGQDIPKILQDKRRQYPQIKIEMLQYLGADPMLLELLEKILLA